MWMGQRCWIAGLAVVMWSGSAVAEVVTLPVSGLRVALPAGPEQRWEVRGELGPAVDPFVRADVLTHRVGGKAVATYAIRAGHAQDAGCPMEQPFPLRVAEVDWIWEPRAAAGAGLLCARIGERGWLMVEIRATTHLTPGDHEPAIAAIYAAYARPAVGAARPLSDPRVTREQGTQKAARWALPRSGLALDPPDDGFLWRVVAADPGRAFDVLIRLAPSYPDVRVEVQRLPRSAVASCAALRAVLHHDREWHETPALTGGPAGLTGGSSKRVARWTSEHLCLDLDDATLQVRLTSFPPLVDLEALAPLLVGLAEAARDPERPARLWALDRGPVASTRALMWWAALEVGFATRNSRTASSSPDVRALSPGGHVSGLWGMRNGPLLWARGALSAELSSLIGGELGDPEEGGVHAEFLAEAYVTLGIGAHMTVGLGVGYHGIAGPLVRGSAMSTSLLFAGNLFVRDRATWIVGLTPAQFFSTSGRDVAAPLSASVHVMLRSGWTMGLELQYVGEPDDGTDTILDEGFAAFLRVGVGHIAH